MYASVLKGAPLGNQNAAGPHNMSGGPKSMPSDRNDDDSKDGPHHESAVKVAARLKNINPDIEDSDLEMLTTSARRMLANGWAQDEVVSHAKNSEEVNPKLSEDVALARMRKVTDAVRARMQGSYAEMTAAQGIGVPAKGIDDHRARAVPSYSGTGKEESGIVEKNCGADHGKKKKPAMKEITKKMKDVFEAAGYVAKSPQGLDAPSDAVFKYADELVVFGKVHDNYELLSYIAGDALLQANGLPTGRDDLTFKGETEISGTLKEEVVVTKWGVKGMKWGVRNGKGKSGGGGKVDGSKLVEGNIAEGDRVKATDTYGGLAGTIKDPRDGKSFVVVEHDDGTFASYHYTDLRNKATDDDEDDSPSIKPRKKGETNMSTELKERMMKSELGFSTSLLGGGVHRDTGVTQGVNRDQHTSIKEGKVISGMGADLGGKTTQAVEVTTKQPWNDFFGVK